MRMRFFDFEVTPNWWLCVFGDYPENITDKDKIPEGIKKTFVAIDSDMPDARARFLELIREQGFVQSGYNIKRYDLIIGNAVYQGFTPQQIYIISNMIIDPSTSFSSKEHIRLCPFTKKKLQAVTYQDLMDDGEGSLKEKEAVLGLDIHESNVPFDKEDLTPEDKADLIYYCRHDVYAAMVFFHRIVRPYTEAKLALGRRFDIPEAVCRSSTNAKLVSIALNAIRTHLLDREKIELELPPKIRQYCYDNLPSKVLEHIRTSTEGLTVTLFENEVNFGNGGIHSVLTPNLYIESDDEWVLMNVDATSYYPSIMIQLDCLSRAVRSPELFTEIFDERVRIKHLPNPTKKDQDDQKAYKLILNTTFGASGNKYLDLYDPHHCTKVCRVGQIFLGALACKLHRTVPNLKVIQTNTDGILIYCRRKDLDKVRECTAEWTRYSGIKMEEDEAAKIWQRDVNNYLMVTTDGKVKRKGGWLIDSYEKPGYVMVGALSAFVSAKAVTEYLLNGTDIVQSIVANKNVEDFVMTCKKGPNYSGVIQKFADGTTIHLFKCNRVIATTDENAGMIYKLKKYKGRISETKMPNIPEHCKLMNESLDSYDFNDIRKELDYMFYINRAADLLDMQWKQLKGTSLEITHQFDYFD